MGTLPSNEYDGMQVIRNKQNRYLSNHPRTIHPNEILVVVDTNSNLGPYINGQVMPRTQPTLPFKPYIMDSDEDEDDTDMYSNGHGLPVMLIGGASEQKASDEIEIVDKPDSPNEESGDSSSGEEIDSSSDEDIDPESSSDEDIDPEADDNEDAPEPEPASTAVALDNKDSVAEVEVEEDLYEEEYVLEEDIEYAPDEDIVVYEEELIPEDKVVANDKQQGDDVFNELVKMMPEKHRLNHKLIDLQKKILQNYLLLKNEFSILDENNDIIDVKIKGDNYKPLVQSLNNFDKHNLYKPIVNEQKELYQYEPENENEEIEFEDEDATSNTTKILALVAIKKKYKYGANRLKYSLYAELNELYKAMECYEPTKPGYNAILNNDIEVFSNTYTAILNTANGKTSNKNKHMALGHSRFMPNDPDDIMVKGQEINNIGYVKYPDNYNYTPKLYDGNKNLAEIVAADQSKTLMKEDIEDDNIFHISASLKIGDKVSVCLEKQVHFMGEIVNIEDNSYIVQPDNDTLPESDIKLLKLEKKDTGVSISKLNSVSKSKCYGESKDVFSVYLYENMDNKLIDNLNLIVPNSREIIENNAVDAFRSVNEFSTILNKYDLSINDLTHNNFKYIETVLNTNNNSKSKSKSFNSVDLEKYRADTNIIQKRQNHKFINNKMLDTLKEFYGPYPYFNTKHDSQEHRLRFIHHQPDNGLLFYKMLVYTIETKLLDSKDRRVATIEKYLDTIQAQKLQVEEDVALYNTDIENKECGTIRLTNIYYSLEELLVTNNTQAYIDEDKIIPNESDNYVKNGNYAILMLGSNNKVLYVRNRGVWEKKSDENIEDILQDHKAFCEQNGIGLRNMPDDLLEFSNCKFSDKLNKCVSIEYLKIKDKLDNLNEIIYENQANLESLRNSGELMAKHETEIKSIRNYVELEYRKKINIEKHFSKLYSEIKQDDDEEYQELYYKIDKYQENIASLIPKDYYEGLEILIKKYGRPNSELETDHEKRNFIYCRKGSKIICCNHHNYFIEFYNNIITADQLQDKLLTDYGIENEGYIWCNNCGQELNLSEYETLEGFTNAGSRDVTHEVVQDEQEYVSKDGSELVASLQHMLLEGDNKSIKDDKSLSIIKIIDVLIKFMGINLTKEDEIAVFKSCELLSNNNIKDQTTWITAAKKSKKSISQKALEVAYANYKTRNIILYTTANLFVYIQSANPPYMITKSHSICKPSLNGYPLDKTYKFEGIDYISCILNALKDTGSDWISLKKVKIKDSITKIIDQLIKDDIIAYRYVQRHRYQDDQNDIIENAPIEYKWDNFKPPLNPFKSELESYGKPRSTKSIGELTQREKLLTIDLMAKINAFIDDAAIENIKYDPTPLDNSCCLEDINNNKYLNYFADKNEDIYTIIETLKYIYKQKKEVLNNSRSQPIYIKTQPRPLSQTFKKDIEIVDEITEDDIRSLFVHFINKGPYMGNKYIFDSNGICQLTGVNKLSLFESLPTLAEYYELKTVIKQQNYWTIDSRKYGLNSNILTHIIDNNVSLQNNAYLVDINNQISSNMDDDDIILDIIEQINVEVDTLTKNLVKHTGADENKLNAILQSLGETHNMFEANKKQYGQQKASDLFFIKKEELIKTYIKKNLSRTIYRINNGYVYPFNQIESRVEKHWKLDESVSEHLDKLHHNAERIITKFDDITSGELETPISIIKSSTKYIAKLKGSPKTFISYKLSGYIHHYIFVSILSAIIENEVDKIDKAEMVLVMEEPDDIDDIESDNDYDIDLTKNIEYKKNAVLNLMNSIITSIDTDTKFVDKHSNTYIQNMIEHKSENDKESNLRFIRDLDREAWSSLKNMIALGMDTWKNLSSKDSELYTDATLNEEPEINLQQQAIASLGADYTEAQYNEWQETYTSNQSEDQLAYEERDIMEDDDE
jgi:hypothetical protein